MKHSITKVFLFFTAIFFLSGCTQKKKDGQTNLESEKVTRDGAGRTIVIPESLDGGIVTIGSSGPLRFLSIFDVFDYVVEVDKGDITDNKNGRAYSYAYPYDSFSDNQWHPDNALESQTAEKIAKGKPSLIVVQKSVYTNYQENCDLLAQQFPLIVLPEQSMVDFFTEDFTLATWYQDTVHMLGIVLKKEERAGEHIQDVNALLSDIKNLRKTSDKKVYVAGLTWQGSNELTTTFPTYLPLMLSGGINAHGGSETSRVVMDPEAITKIPMDYFVIDPSSSDKLSTSNSQFILSWLYAKNTDNSATNDIRLFATIPMIWDSANYDCVLAGAYYLNHILYDTIDETELMQKIQDVFTAYYGAKGKDVYQKMYDFFEEKSFMNKQEMPLLHELDVIKTGSIYSLRARENSN